MKFRNLLCAFAIIVISIFTNCSGLNHQEFIDEFNKIDPYPKLITFTNTSDINNSGGHLQGIQQIKNKSGEYILMTGSSDTYSYCAVVKLHNENKVISVNHLMDKPFKHAGGFQVFQNYLAVGIEDNSLKNKSKVCIYDVSQPEKSFDEAIAVIERNGEPLRSTAGCVGITSYKNKTLVAVGDWDTKHIDFYTAESNNIAKNVFKLTTTIDTDNISRAGWIDNKWHSYQNINLFNINNSLFLVGLGQNTQSENIADLFEILEKPAGSFILKKVAGKTLHCTEGCNFKAGAGVNYSNGELKLYACGYNVFPVSALNVFGKKTDDKLQ